MFDRMLYISIHAPTRGATHIRGRIIRWKHNFNPRSHERSDLIRFPTHTITFISIHAPTRGATFCIFCNLTSPFLFQSTLPREERLGNNVCFISICYFNPRSHERSDTIFKSLRLLTSISIHAPTRGATSLSHGRLHPVPLFQSTLPREERHIFSQLIHF